MRSRRGRSGHALLLVVALATLDGAGAQYEQAHGSTLKMPVQVDQGGKASSDSSARQRQNQGSRWPWACARQPAGLQCSARANGPRRTAAVPPRSVPSFRPRRRQDDVLCDDGGVRRPYGAAKSGQAQQPERPTHRASGSIARAGRLWASECPRRVGTEVFGALLVTSGFGRGRSVLVRGTAVGPTHYGATHHCSSVLTTALLTTTGVGRSTSLLCRASAIPRPPRVSRGE